MRYHFHGTKAERHHGYIFPPRRAGRKEPVRLFNRSALDPIVYAVLTSGTEEDANARKLFLVGSNNFRKMLQKYRSPKSIVLLLNPVAEWLVDDGVRSLENQEECAMLFKALLKNLEVDFHEFGWSTKSIDERVMLTVGLGRF